LKYLATSGPFQHPSCHRHKRTGVLGGTKQAAQPRDERGYVKVPQFMFPDAGKFGGSILNCPVEDITDVMETYSEVVLTLFMRFRTIEDFKPVSAGILNPRHPMTLRLRELWEESQYARLLPRDTPAVFTNENLELLQNIQDCAYNGMRYKKNKEIVITAP
jgi:hypothetical protein